MANWSTEAFYEWSVWLLFAFLHTQHSSELGEAFVFLLMSLWLWFVILIVITTLWVLLLLLTSLILSSSDAAFCTLVVGGPLVKCNGKLEWMCGRGGGGGRQQGPPFAPLIGPINEMATLNCSLVWGHFCERALRIWKFWHQLKSGSFFVF